MCLLTADTSPPLFESVLAAHAVLFALHARVAAPVRTLGLQSVHPSAAPPCCHGLRPTRLPPPPATISVPCSGGKDGSLRRHRYESGRRMAAEVPFGQLHTLAAGVLVK